MKYRKKPVVVEAKQLTPETAEHIGTWCGAMLCEYGSYSSYLWGWALAPRERTLRIPTLEGDMSANIGDWIIQGIAGEFYPCKPDIFELTYEKVE